MRQALHFGVRLDSQTQADINRIIRQEVMVAGRARVHRAARSGAFLGIELTPSSSQLF